MQQTTENKEETTLRITLRNQHLPMISQVKITIRTENTSFLIGQRCYRPDSRKIRSFKFLGHAAETTASLGKSLPKSSSFVEMRLRSAVTAISTHVRRSGSDRTPRAVGNPSFPKVFGIPARRRAGENSSCEAQSAM
jgi:hypothetical protein